MLHITLVYSPSARRTYEIQLEVPEGSSVQEALESASAHPGFQELDISKFQLGVWGRKATDTQLLRNLDRIEIYRPLKVNPKVARRERFAKQGARKTGLFAKPKS
jgi:putative ubiquitin-RnfH superfamily antitoxin RatB of RatAB toxin-antitoxin module